MQHHVKKPTTKVSEPVLYGQMQLADGTSRPENFVVHSASCLNKDTELKLQGEKTIDTLRQITEVETGKNFNYSAMYKRK
jgi:hypothetical protein